MSLVDSLATAAVPLPWGAWYEDSFHELRLPAHWQTDVLEPPLARALACDEIDRALMAPIGCRPLWELARGQRTACVVVDDLARPTKASDILPPLLRQLHEAGIARQNIAIVIATGSHTAPGPGRVAWKVGADVAATYRVETHRADGELASTGIMFGDHELRLNRTFLEADLKVGIGAALPHSFAGYSGGAKLMLPGLSDLACTSRSHKFVQMGLRGGANPNTNRFRTEIEEFARQVGFEYCVTVVPNARRETAGVFAGDIVAAHRKACEFAAEKYRVDLHRTYDCLVLNAYPKDSDLLQADNALVALKGLKSPAVRDGGVLVVASAACEGLGHHGLFGPGGLNYRPPRQKPGMGEREIWLYAPSVTEEEARTIHWERFPFFRDSQALAEALAQRFAGATRTAVLPSAPIEQLHDMRSESATEGLA